jgi:tRNA 2-thiocytidine biosynthesis protein TtcA
MQRKVIKQMMIDWEKNYPNRKEIMLTALSKVHLSHLLDPSTFDFIALEERSAHNNPMDH